MPNKPSAIKELRKAKKRAAHNNRVKTNVKALQKKCVELIKAGNLDEAKRVMVLFQRAIDKAAKVNVVSKNRASRKKSSIMKMISKK